MQLKCHIGFRGQAHSSSCRQAEGQEGPCCCKRDDDVDLRRLWQTMRLAHWSVCPSQVAPMTWGSVDLDDSVHRVCLSAIISLELHVRYASDIHHIFYARCIPMAVARSFSNGVVISYVLPVL